MNADPRSDRDGSTLFDRRRALRLLTGAGALGFLAACGAKGSSTGATPSTVATTASAAATTGSTAATTGSTNAAATETSVIPEETAGPYPGDGSNGVNVLTQHGIVRQDIRASFGSSTTVAEGVPTTVELTIVDAVSGRPLEGAAVYLWHCDRDGAYSLYSTNVRDENYLRGVQAADADGVVTFRSIFPACYSGRWPHIHFEVYPSLDAATSASGRIATSQLALPADVCTTVYATDGYAGSRTNMKQVSLATDNVFRDGAERETPTMTGDVTNGYVIALTVAVNA